MKHLLFAILLILFSSSVIAQTTASNKLDTGQLGTQLPPVPCCCEEEKSDCIKTGEKIQTTEIKLDFKTKDVGNPKEWYKLKKGDFVRVKIMNYNPNLYKIILDNKDSSVAAPIDGKLSWFVDPGNIGTLAANILGGASSPPLKASTATGVEKFLKGDFDPDNISRLQLMFQFDMEDPIATKEKNNGKIVIVPPTHKDSIKTVDSLMDIADNLISNRKDEIYNLIHEIDAKQYELLRQFAILRKLYPNCEDFKNVFSDADRIALEAKIEEFRAACKKIIDKTTDELKVYTVITSPYKQIIGKEAKLNVEDSLIRQFYKEALTNITKTQESLNFKSIADIIAKLETVTLFSSCYVSLPIFMGDDVKKINIELRPRFYSLVLPGYSTSLTLPFVQQRIWGVSSGVFVSGLYNDAFNSMPFTKANPIGGTDTLYKLVKDNNGKLQMGISALAYAGTKLNSSNNKPNYLALTFGAGLTFESKPKPRVMFGIAFVTGEKNRLLISVGGIAGNVSRLSNAYDLNGEYIKVPTGVVKDVLKANAFLSINYSFLSK